MNTDLFALRHIGPRATDHDAMLKTIGASSMDQLISETLPDNIKLQKPLDLGCDIVMHSASKYLKWTFRYDWWHCCSR